MSRAEPAPAGSRQGSRQGPFRVALTFDAEHPDRPATPGAQERLLDELGRLDVPATFFVQGRWAEAYPATAARIPAEGHLVGSHSFYHARMHLLSALGLRTDIAAAQEAVIAATGVDPRPWFRLPFGAGASDPRVRRSIHAAGYRHVGWHVAGIDWPIDRTATQVEAAVVGGAVAHGDGCVVLLHTWPDPTWIAMATVVARLRGLGAELVRVDELPAALVPDEEVSDAPEVRPSPA